jgi:hypothetical protein
MADFKGYSLNDIYPNSGMSNVVQTSAETIPEDDEREHYTDSTSQNSDGKSEVVDKKIILGALLAGIVLLVVLDRM